MSALFDAFEFSGITLRNRFVRSATVDNLTNKKNQFTPAHLKLYTDLARGGVGLIIAGALRPRREWAMDHVFQQPCLDVPGIADDLRNIAKAVHRLGAAFVCQISPPFKIHGKQVSGSSMDVDMDPEPLDEHDIAEIKAAYRSAGQVLKSAGCDGVQLHCCHNDVLSRMISPFFNRRKDQYGGVPANRARMVLELAREIKEGAGDDFPVMIKMNASDFREDGMTVEDAAAVAQILAENGIAAIEPSCGGADAAYSPSGPILKEDWHEGYLIEYAARIKKVVQVPVMVVGGMRDLEMMEDVIATGKGDLISMCRPFIREPNLVKRWSAGDFAPAQCISCDSCLKETMRGRRLRCVQVTRSDGTPKK